MHVSLSDMQIELHVHVQQNLYTVAIFKPFLNHYTHVCSQRLSTGAMRIRAKMAAAANSRDPGTRALVSSASLARTAKVSGS